jgi:flagellar hook-associated protein 3 FlgL
VRITSNAIQQETLAAIRNTMSGLADAQRRVATGKRVHEPSDDPVAADGILRSARRSRALEQYARNIDRADARLRAEETVLDTVTNLLSRAKELAHTALSPTADEHTLESAAREIDGLLDAAVEQANSRFGDGFLFGGATADTAPFESGGTVATGAEPAGAHRVDIGTSSWFTTNHDGEQVFLDTDVFDALSELSTALRSGDRTATANAISGIDHAFGEVQELLAEVGARTNRLSVARSNVEAFDLNLQTLRSDLEDAEMEEAVTQLVGRQMAYQSALLAASKIMSTTLTDYLR